MGVVISDSFGRPWRNGVVGVAIGAAGLGDAGASNADAIIFDTAGRLQIDQELIDEVKRLRERIRTSIRENPLDRSQDPSGLEDLQSSQPV